MRTTAQIDAEMVKLREKVEASKEALRKLARERDEAAAKEAAEAPPSRTPAQEIGGSIPVRKARKRSGR